MKLEKQKWDSLVFGVVLVIAGSLFFFLGTRFALFLFASVAFVFLLRTSYQLMMRWFKPIESKKASGVQIFLNVLLSLFFVNNALLPTSLLAFVVTLEFFAIGVCLLIDYFLGVRNQSQPSLLTLGDGLVHLILGLITLFQLNQSLDSVYRFIGISLLIRGVSMIHEAIGSNRKMLDETGRRKRFGLPIFLSALIPVSAIRFLNRLFSPERSQPILLENMDTKGRQPDIEIWIHTARQGFEMMGHVDISYKGVTYAYGQYDVDKSTLFGMIGDGVLFRLSSQDYLASLEADDWRVVVGYGMVLTEEQKTAVEKRLQEVMEATVPFVLKSEEQKASYLGQLHNHYGVESFKFSHSKFKTYFVMTTNCVLLADTILEIIGTDNVANHGILTPGIYQDYFEREYQKPHSSVITKFIVGKQKIEEETI